MIAALEEFFPDSGVLDEFEEFREFRQARAKEGTAPHPLHRVNTGVSSIVGPDNGERPGGFVLVIDGAALTDVRLRCLTVSQ